MVVVLLVQLKPVSWVDAGCGKPEGAAAASPFSTSDGWCPPRGRASGDAVRRIIGAWGVQWNCAVVTTRAEQPIKPAVPGVP